MHDAFSNFEHITLVIMYDRNKSLNHILYNQFRLLT